MTVVRSNPATTATAAAPFDIAETDRLLTTTRAVRRRLDLDRPVAPETIEACIELATQAPSANNKQNWRWIAVTDRDRIRRIAEYYSLAWQFHSTAASTSQRRRRGTSGVGSQQRSLAAGNWLVENLERIPVLVFPCVVGRPPLDEESFLLEAAWTGAVADRKRPSPVRASMYYGSIYPAVWSFQLALRSRGLGTVITVAHLIFENDIAEILRVPSMVTQICMLPVAYTVGTDFRPGPRFEGKRRTYWNEWDGERPATELEGSP